MKPPDAWYLGCDSAGYRFGVTTIRETAVWGGLMMANCMPLHHLTRDLFTGGLVAFYLRDLGEVVRFEQTCVVIGLSRQVLLMELI